MLAKIYSSALNLLTPLSLEETYKRVTDQAMQLVGAKYGTIFVAQSGILQRVYASSPALYRVIPRRDGNTAKVFREKNYFLLDRNRLKKSQPKLENLKFGDDLSISLTYNKVNIGVLSLLSFTHKRFTKEDVNIVKAFTPLATLAIRKARLYEDLKRSLEARDLFISIAAHELKTPLTSIMLYTQMIDKMVTKGNTPKQEYIKSLLREEGRMAKLINELLQIHQIKTGKLNFEMEKCDLKSVVVASLSDGRKMLVDHTMKFSDKLRKKHAYVSGDFNKLFQAVSNLLNNAAKYSPMNSKITVVLKSVGGHFILEIIDEGMGIPAKDLPRIFERFYQGGNGSKKPGMGLGLYLVHHIIQKHNGEVFIKSEVGKGTAVTVKLPKYSYG